MIKDRKYRITIQMPIFNATTKRFEIDDPIVIERLTADITVVKNVFSMGGMSKLVITNLQPETLNYLSYDRYADFVRTIGSEISEDNIESVAPLLGDDLLFPQVTIELGYGEDLITIMTGVVQKITPGRRGPDLIAQIDLTDSGFFLIKERMSSDGITLVSGVTTLRNALNRLFEATKLYSVNYKLDLNNSGLETTDLFKIFSSKVKTKTIQVSGRRFEESFRDILQEYGITSFKQSNSSIVAVDDVVSFVIDSDEESIEKINGKGSVHTIDSRAGLMSPPTREELYIRVELSFNPYIRVGDRVELNSTILDRYNFDAPTEKSLLYGENRGSQNGSFVVQSVQHSGTFSETVGGTVVTTLQLYVGGRTFGANRIRT